MLPGDQQIPCGPHLLLYSGNFLLNSLAPGHQHLAALPSQQANDGELLPSHLTQDEVNGNCNNGKHLSIRKVNMADSIVGDLTMAQVCSKTTI